MGMRIVAAMKRRGRRKRKNTITAHTHQKKMKKTKITGEIGRKQYIGSKESVKRKT